MEKLLPNVLRRKKSISFEKYSFENYFTLSHNNISQKKYTKTQPITGTQKLFDEEKIQKRILTDKKYLNENKHLLKIIYH